jgi:hypothetical protein
MSFAHSRRPIGRRFFVGVLVATLAGCGGGPNVYPVSGSVRLKGKPLAGATVTFAPVGEGRAAVATTEPDGTFRLNTNLPGGSGGSGALPGDYKVTVSKFVPPDGMTEAEYEKKAAADAAKRESGAYNPDVSLPAKVETVPPGYSDGAKTKLKAAVTSGGPNEFSFDIP